VSVAGRARVVELVAGTTLTPEHPALVHVGGGAQAPLEEHVGRTRLYELVDDAAAEGAHIAPLTMCDTPLWQEGWRLRVRYETAGPFAHGDTRAQIAADVRAITKSLRVASDWAAVLEHLQVGHQQYTVEEVPGPEGEPLALIAELPLRARFYE
jgi:hypothetical protein